jgi:hypothetical protein
VDHSLDQPRAEQREQDVSHDYDAIDDRRLEACFTSYSWTNRIQMVCQKIRSSAFCDNVVRDQRRRSPLRRFAPIISVTDGIAPPLQKKRSQIKLVMSHLRNSFSLQFDKMTMRING